MYTFTELGRQIMHGTRKHILKCQGQRAGSVYNADFHYILYLVEYKLQLCIIKNVLHVISTTKEQVNPFRTFLINTYDHLVTMANQSGI